MAPALILHYHLFKNAGTSVDQTLSAYFGDGWRNHDLPDPRGSLFAEDIEDMVPPRRGFGSVPVVVRCGTSEWRTSVFPDSRSGSYVLPVKKAVRAKQGLEIGEPADFEIDVVPE